MDLNILLNVLNYMLVVDIFIDILTTKFSVKQNIMIVQYIESFSLWKPATKTSLRAFTYLFFLIW